MRQYWVWQDLFGSTVVCCDRGLAEENEKDGDENPDGCPSVEVSVELEAAKAEDRVSTKDPRQ